VEENQKQSRKMRKGDRVVAIAGNAKGQFGIVQSLKGDKVIVQGLNVRKKHVKRSQDAPKGRIVEIELPINISNLKVCVEGDTAARLRIRINEKGERHLVYKIGEEERIYRSVKKPK